MMIRAYPKDCTERTPDKLEYGWYFEVSGKPLLLPSDLVSQDMLKELRYLLVHIDITTAAVKTGRQDKNGDDIYGSKGEMKGGDRVRYKVIHGPRNTSWQRGIVCWNERRSMWSIDGLYSLPLHNELEIIKGAKDFLDSTTPEPVWEHGPDR